MGFSFSPTFPCLYESLFIRSVSMMVDLKKVRWLVVSVVVLILNVAGAAPHVHCFFNFGDSSSATANYLHHQNDFPSERTKMFSDNFIAELLTFEDYIPPYATAHDEEYSEDVNYSSPAARTRYGSDHHLGGRISLKEQVKNYQTTVTQIVNILGDEDTAANHLKECVYLVGIGSNGYINNYIMPDGRQFAPEKQADAVIRQYSEQLRRRALPSGKCSLSESESVCVLGFVSSEEVSIRLPWIYRAWLSCNGGSVSASISKFVFSLYFCFNIIS